MLQRSISKKQGLVEVLLCLDFWGRRQYMGGKKLFFNTRLTTLKTNLTLLPLQVFFFFFLLKFNKSEDDFFHGISISCILLLCIGISLKLLESQTTGKYPDISRAESDTAPTYSRSLMTGALCWSPPSFQHLHLR